MTILFQTDISIQHQGFVAEYRTHCGGRLTDASGTIRSPSPSGSSYLPNSNCSWVVAVNPGRTIAFSFRQLDLDCQQDSLKILNGNSDDSPVLWQLNCSNPNPPVVNTSAHLAQVLFTSAPSQSSRAGFIVDYDEVSVVCGERLSLSADRPSGVFTSPLYPDRYHHNLDCVWLFTAPTGKRIRIDFNHFDIEDHSDCNYDYLEFRDGGTENSPLLSRHCGNQLPSSILSSANVMYARMRTDFSETRTGFSATYKIASCGGSLNLAEGDSYVITTPNYPSQYPQDTDCDWRINAPTGHYLTLEFTNFDLGAAPQADCSQSDYVIIGQVNRTGFELEPMKRLCGREVPAGIRTPDSRAYVRFTSLHVAGAGSGFRLVATAAVEECGGELTGASGVFTSPNYPYQYAHSRVCRWIITVPEGRRVTIQFDDFGIEDQEHCNYDKLEIKNGGYPDSPIQTRLCGENVLPTTLYNTSAHQAIVIFTTDGSQSNRGFSARYSSNLPAVCGGTLRASQGMSGFLAPPGYGSYPVNLQCEWKLINDLGGSIDVGLIDLDLERHGECIYDWLEFKEGPTYQNGHPLSGKLCGNLTQNDRHHFMSPWSHVYIRFRTDFSENGRGFNLTYNFRQCGGILSNPIGELTSPNYPAPYEHATACSWLIQSIDAAKIHLQFIDFELEPNHPQASKCVFDYVALYNGPLQDSPLVGKFCNTTKPDNLTSEGSALRVEFYTDATISFKGFRARYTHLESGCGGDYHSDAGNFSSPGYLAGSYPPNSECEWKLNAPFGSHINVRFLGEFRLESNPDGSCPHDYVELSYSSGRAGEADTIIGRYCHDPPRNIIMSPGNRLKVKFRSDESVSHRGFFMSWSIECGATLYESQGWLTSPNYNQPYDNNLNCTWTIQPPNNDVFIVFTTSNFRLEPHDECRYDVLTFYHGNSTLSPSLGRFCGTNKPPVMSSRGALTLALITDASQTDTGFSASWTSRVCGGHFSGQGYISTPTAPDNYHHNLNCSWHMTATDGKVVLLSFETFDLEAAPNCIYDRLMVFDGPTISSRLIGTFCGSIIPDVITSSSRYLTAQFISDHSLAHAGFKASFRSTYACGGSFNDRTGHIQALDVDGDGTYENDLLCVWTVSVPDDHVVMVNITDYDIERADDGNPCRFDYLKIYDGATDDYSPLLDKLCGTSLLTPPRELRAASNVIRVVFSTDSSITRRGFNLYWSSTPRTCGGVLDVTDSQNTLQSPGYPGHYEHNLRCRWVLSTNEPMSKIEVNITHLDIEYQEHCGYDWLSVQDFPPTAAGREVHYCSSALPPAFYSIGDMLMIEFRTDHSTNGTGFSLTYKATTCNMTITGQRSGRLLSPGWPQAYPNHAHCLITIVAPTFDHVIDFYFNDFDVESEQNCQFDRLSFYNSTTPNEANRVRSECGSALPSPVFTGTGQAAVLFSADYSIGARGYDVTWLAHNSPGCGATLELFNGTFTSPNFPRPYPNDVYCEWKIRSPSPRYKLYVTLPEFNLEEAQGCIHDYLRIQKPSGEIIEQLCGATRPERIETLENELSVIFRTDHSITLSGFRLQFVAVAM